MKRPLSTISSEELSLRLSQKDSLALKKCMSDIGKDCMYMRIRFMRMRLSVKI